MLLWRRRWRFIQKEQAYFHQFVFFFLKKKKSTLPFFEFSFELITLKVSES